jgi:FkbM family methyltransferase
MAAFRTTVRQIAMRTPVYYPARDVFLAVFDPRTRQRIARAKALYSQFINSGDLVFDVGANNGSYTEIFLEMGGRVVAVEPNPACARKVLRLHWAGWLKVEQAAAGDQEGWAEMQMGRHDSISTLSGEFADNYKQTRPHAFAANLRVPVTTLDALAARYGVPRFVKVDAEGLDDRVIQGMNFRPDALSFEFLPQLPHVAKRALDLLGDDYVYNFTPGTDFRLSLGEWPDKAGMESYLEHVQFTHSNADVLARRRGA